VLEEYKQIAKAYALKENAIVSMGDNMENRSYCYFGGLADVLGIPMEERKDTISSLYEEFVFGRTNADDLACRHAHELVFLHGIEPLAAEERMDFYLSDFLRIHDAQGEWHWVEHRMFPLACLSDNSIWLCMCVYSMGRGTTRKPKIVNTRTGEVRILTNQDYASLLSQRELEVLRLIADGLLSKEIADHLSISINTVNRHRQNIFEKLHANNAIEACKIARVMGIF